MDLVKELQKVPAFSEIPTEDLAWMAERGEVHSFEEGEVFFSRGDVVEHLNILLEGEIEIRLPQKDGVMPLGSLKKGSITGKLPFSRMQSATAGGVIIKSASVFSLHESYFSELIKTSEPITRVLVWEMTDRARDFTIRQRQHEKLLALGKLSAGLSHELNNPASAVLRSAETLKKHLGQTPERFKRVTGIRLTEEQIDAVNQAIFSCAAEGVKHLSLMERTQLEDDLLDWLEDHGVEEPDEIAENLADYKFSIDKLEFILEHVGEEFLDPVIRWTDNVLITERLVDEIEQASRRISDLVKSIKSYTHMDQAIQLDAVDIRPGIENTLTMLGHKLKKKQIEVDLEIPEDLPQVHGIVGELNQVWTNLLDNAIDALPKGGLINIKAFCLPDLVRVKLIDNGTGIPEEVQSRIFEPFFTTKGIGEGTGLGLDIVKKVLHNHKGSIDLNSEPGRTEFCISLPISKK